MRLCTGVPGLWACTVACALMLPMLSATAPLTGVVNAVDGDATVDGNAVSAAPAGFVTLSPTQTIRTGQGMAEVLLTPGVFLRLGHRSEAILESSAAETVEVRISRGEAMVEALRVPNAGSVEVDENGVKAVIEKPGLYDFNRDRGSVLVLDGSARIFKGGQETIAGRGFGVKVRKLRPFKAAAQDVSELYAWSTLRSRQLSLESAASAESYDPRGAHGSSGPAWYWDPWSASYTFLPASGSLDSPFGWPFYAPGHSHNAIPVHSGDSFLYGPPVPALPSTGGPATVPVQRGSWPTVPLTAPGVPQFPGSR